MRISDWSSDVCSSDLLGPSNDPDINHYELTRFGFRIVGPIALKDQIESADWEALAAMPWITPLDTSMAYAAVLGEMFTSRGLTPRSVARFDNASLEIGRAHVRTPVTNAHIDCRLLHAKK